MPELLEIEMYRRLAERVVGRDISSVETLDPAYVRGGEPEALDAALVRGSVVGTRRRGKLLLLDVADPGDAVGQPGSVLGLRFGMTGRLLVDAVAAIDKLEYSSGRDDPAWDRFRLHFEDGGTLAMRDPRRLGSVELDPDDAALGPDAWSITAAELGQALQSTSPLKARLLDQRRIGGLGNLLTDEILWRSALAPERRADSLDDAEILRLHAAFGPTLDQLFERGGSHRGDLQAERDPEGHCPRDGAPLTRSTVGGRTTYWCAQHQR